MNLKNQIIAILICYLISFFFIRGFLYGIKRYQLNNSSYKKRKKNESLKEWLLYSRYTQEIPKILYILYFFVLLIHPICLIVCIFTIFTELSLNIGELLVIFIGTFDCVWMLIIALLFWSPGADYAYDRWITKKRGQKPKRRKH